MHNLKLNWTFHRRIHRKKVRKQSGTSKEDGTECDSSSKSLSSSVGYAHVWFTCNFNTYIIPFT